VRQRTERRGPSLVYVLGKFPSISETFILREMQALEGRGRRLCVLSLEPSHETVHADARGLAERTVYRPAPLSVRSLLAQLLAALSHPLGYLSALAFALRAGARAPGAIPELLRSLWAAGYFACALRGRRARHVHAHFASMPATVGLLLAHILGTTFSFSAHARDIFTGESLVLERKLGEAEFVTVCTRYGLDYLRRQHPVAVGERLNLIYHGVNIVELMPLPARPAEPPIILSVGRLVEKKGFPILLRAAAILRSTGLDFELHIVGDGPDADDLRHLAGGLGLSDCTRFHGSMPHEELIPLFQSATLFTLASVVASDGDRDGLPNVFVEALALGIPAVGTNVSAIPEIIEHERTGLLARPGDPEDLADAMERLVLDEQLRARVIEQGRRLVLTKFDIQQNVGALLKLFERVMSRRR